MSKFDKLISQLRHERDAYVWYAPESIAAQTMLVEIDAYEQARREAMVADKLAQFDAEMPVTIIGERVRDVLTYNPGPSRYEGAIYHYSAKEAEEELNKYNPEG